MTHFVASHGLQQGEALMTPPQVGTKSRVLRVPAQQRRSFCVFIRLTERKRGGRESKEKTRRQVVMRVHKWLIKPWFLLVAVVKQF